jgi:hypothetical protein
MKLIRHKTSDIGAMGDPLYASYYECLKCGGCEQSWEYGAADLAQQIDKNILDKILDKIVENKI